MKRTKPNSLLLVSLLLAYGLFRFTFKGPRRAFWSRMTYTGALLGALSVVAQPRLRETKFTLPGAILGLGSAGVLYGIFQIGDRMARRILPNGSQEIDQIYGLDQYGNRREIGARLAFIIGPAEELFWRGFLQSQLVYRFGPILGTALATSAYGGAHLVTGNITLIGAATVAGAFWGTMAMLGAPTDALIISHAFWDVLIFLIFPTRE